MLMLLRLLSPTPTFQIPSTPMIAAILLISCGSTLSTAQRRRCSRLWTSSTPLIAACMWQIILCSLHFPTRGENDVGCLVAFRASLQDTRATLSSWRFTNKSAGYVCDFYGATCWFRNENKILALSLRNSGLAGNPFPPGLAKCRALADLDLSGNSFSGPLPSQLCEWLPYLTSLNLSHNQFSGQIPYSLKDCQYLQTLQLQSNLFSGQIPWELATVTNLVNLDFSRNLLSGPIPSLFANMGFSASSFQGNPHLCGAPLPSSCFSQRHAGTLLLSIPIASALFLLLLSLIAFAHRQYSQQYSSTSICPTFLQTFDPYLRLSWQSLEQATSGFSHANIVGVGGSATVYKGQLPHDRMIAIKLLHEEDKTLSCDVQKQFLTELEVLGKLRHRNLVKILGYYFNGQDKLAIILDFMPMGSLEALLHNHRALPETILSRSEGQLAHCPEMDWAARYRILLGVAEGLTYLHHEYDGKRCVVHGDLKPGNVLLDAAMEAHIADFGLARMVRATNTTSMPTPSQQRVMSNGHWWSLGYTAPELAHQGLVSRKMDVFSFGVMVLEVLTGERPSSAKLGEGQTLAEWVGEALARGVLHMVVAPELMKEAAEIIVRIGAALELGCRCVSYRPSARPDMHQVLTVLHDLAHKREPHSATTLCANSTQNHDELLMLCNTPELEGSPIGAPRH